MPDDDVLTRAKAERDRYLETGRMETIRPINEVISLAEKQAKKLAEIREQCVNFTPDPDLVAAIIAIIDGKQP